MTLNLHLHLDTTLRSRRAALLQRGEEIGDVVPRMPVQTSPEPLLVEIMGNQTDGTTKHEQTIEDTHLHIVLGLLLREGAAVAHQVNEADSNAAIDVENKIVLLGGGDSLDSKSVIEELAAGEGLLNEVLHKLDTEIRVVSRLDSVTDTGD
jgi:hypothetical protein